MKKVFHVISHFDLGGAERVALNIASSRNPEVEYHLVEVMRGRSPLTAAFIDDMRRKGIRFHRSPFPLLVSWHYVLDRLIAALFPLRWLWLWWRYRPDVVHTHTETPDLAVWLAFKCMPWLWRKCRLVRTIHNTVLWTGQAKTGLRVERFIQSHGRNVAISVAVQERFAERFGQCPPIIYNGVASVTQEVYPHLVPNRVNVVFAGRLERQKGIATLVEVVRALAPEGRWHFHIFGKGALAGEVDSLRDLDCVTVRPPLPDITKYLGSFDCLLMPSEFEGFGLMAVEASLAGLPTIINRCEGLRETLPEDWPLAVDGNSVEQYLHILRDVLPQADRQSLAATAREYAEKQFSMHEMQEAYEKLYL